MAELIIRLEVDPTTGRKNVVIGYRSDSDALPMEHEADHKALVDQLVAGGILTPDELGEIRIEREGHHTPEQQEDEPPEATPQSETQ